jgi:GNAT superfamily N-acetyltransferase
VIVELLPPDTARAFEAMRELRPHLTSLEDFVRQVDEVQRQDGYRLAAWVPDDRSPASAVAGFRFSENLAWGRHLYVDDLSTHPSARRKGHARELLDWIAAEAQRLGCRSVQLDSGVGENRAVAHALYFREGFRIADYHFSRQL